MEPIVRTDEFFIWQFSLRIPLLKKNANKFSSEIHMRKLVLSPDYF